MLGRLEGPTVLCDHFAVMVGLGPPLRIDDVRLLLVPLVVMDDLLCQMVVLSRVRHDCSFFINHSCCPF